MVPRYVINVHAHLHQGQDVAARIRLWRACNLRKVCILCMPAPPGARARADGYLTNEEFVPVLRAHGDILVGMGAVRMFAQYDGP